MHKIIKKTTRAPQMTKSLMNILIARQIWCSQHNWTASSEFGTYRVCEQRVKRNLQTESQIPGPSKWLGMRSWNLSWRNARRHKFAWRGSYTAFFNLVFDYGIIPESWLEGIIRPIYKNNGDTNNPENYRPITILSCFGKLFTAVLN